ncbi:hypothetical protein AC249_AIPGENE10379 [Exaiptasia diaphana]|nr:hypothetical protein AC249_AIPGENE10379 [Exaiptasia diaphana]
MNMQKFLAKVINKQRLVHHFAPKLQIAGCIVHNTPKDADICLLGRQLEEKQNLEECIQGKTNDLDTLASQVNVS